MRKLITLFFLLLAVVIHAQQITPDEAAAIASEFLNSSSPQLATAKRIGVRRAKARTNVADNSLQPYYVFNGDDNRGFVIISGDNRARKILGYSDTGNFNFDNLPPQLSAMLDQYTEQIKQLPESAASDASWSASTRVASADSDGVLLETANWGQGYPYNLQCPEVEGQKCLTGCVATAMAIVMKYHNWPEEYNWDAMPMEQLENPLESLSKLMADVGEAVYMNYGLTESGAHVNWIGHRLQQKFKYSPDCQFITSANFSDEEWISLLKGNLDNNKPVIYNGSGSSGNHAFVIDGYKDDTYHINWGWDGMCNGYYVLHALTPNESQDFSSNTGMVINIVPDKSGKEYSNVFCDRGYFWATGGLVPGSHFSINSPKQNQEFDYTCHTMSYPCNESGQIGLILYDKNGIVKEVLSCRTYTESRDDFGFGIWGNEIEFSDVTISSEVMPDDYITLATRKSLSHPWLEVLGTIEAPLKKSIANIKKDVGCINIINNTQGTKISYYKMYSEWVDLAQEENVIECVKGGKLCLSVNDELGNRCDNVTIKVEGTGIYGNTNLSYDGFTGFLVYGDSYTITIEETETEIERIINLTEPGNLSEILKDSQLSHIGSLSIKGQINAKDLWYIRDNLKSLNSLDISDTKIMGCEAIDPVESFRIGGSEHLEDALPTFALTGLTQLNTLKLPKELRYIGANSLMSLAIARIEIPSTVQTIGLNVFFDCVNLKTVVCRMPQPPVINDCVFTNTMCPTRGVLYIPQGTLDAYKQTVVWQDFDQIIENDNPPTDTDIILFEGLKYRIHGKALYLIGYEQSQLPKDVVIPDAISVNGHEYSVLGIDDYAMQFAEINSFIMPNSITTIGGWIFNGSSVIKVRMSDNIKDLPFCCISGNCIEELHISENAETIGNSLYCPKLKKLHLPKKLHSKEGYLGSIGQEFRSLEEITVDPENEEWSVHDGILYWKGLSHLIAIPNTMAGEITTPEETTQINQIGYCDNITKITLGKGIKSLGYGSISWCENLKHIEFNNDIIFSSNCVILQLPHLESFTIKDFIRGYENSFGGLPSLKYVYLQNTNLVDFSNSFYQDVNLEHDYFSSSLNPQAIIPSYSKIFVPGGVKRIHSNDKMEEMWKYEIDKSNGKIKIEPLIEGLVIDCVTINGMYNTINPNNIYNYNSDSNLDVVVDYTLHNRQSMTTHYDKDFNASLSDTDFLLVKEIVLSSNDMTLNLGKKLQISANVLPENAENKTLIWTTSDESIATIDAEGNVTALAIGEATITATAADGSGVSASCQVTVTMPTLGDANGDGKVSITDAVAIVGHILGESVEGFAAAAADVNGDGKISITDAVAVVDMILDGNASAKTRDTRVWLDPQ